jgi:hypothetical protein
MRQKLLIAKLERQNYGALSLEARQSLKQMEELLARMTAKLTAAERELGPGWRR